MRRRTFLKAVGGVTGTAALGGAPKILAASKKKIAYKQITKHPTKRTQTNTYGLGGAVSKRSSFPFNPHVRLPAWFPDAADFPDQKLSYQRLFPEEVVAKSKNTGKYLPFPVHLKDDNEDGKSWVLGAKLKQVGQVSGKEKNLTAFVRELALRLRKYNASLYRVRRLHFYVDHSSEADQLPPANPWEKDPPKLDPLPSEDVLAGIIWDAEQDWSNVTDDLNSFLETATTQGYNPDPKAKPAIKLLATDMVAVNNYVMSMRVVVEKIDSGGPTTQEMGGSSSHVSISSAFSSSTQ